MQTRISHPEKLLSFWSPALRGRYMKVARSRETVKYRILEKDEEVSEPHYFDVRIVKKGMYEIDDGFHLKFFLSKNEFLKRYEPI